MNLREHEPRRPRRKNLGDPAALQSALEGAGFLSRAPKPKLVVHRLSDGTTVESLDGLIDERVTRDVVALIKNSPYITTSEAAVLAGVSAQAIRKWAKEEKFASVQLGNDTRNMKIAKESYRKFLIEQNLAVPGFTAEPDKSFRRTMLEPATYAKMDEDEAAMAIASLKSILSEKPAPQALAKAVSFLNNLATVTQA